MYGSMTAGEIVREVQDNNPDIKFVGSDHGAIGAYRDGEHLGGLTRPGTLPPRTIFDSNGYIETRGWMDFIAMLWHGGHLARTRRLIALLGESALDHVSKTGQLLATGDYYPAPLQRADAPDKQDWMPTAPV